MIAVDYAETRPAQVHDLLDQLHRRRDRPPSRVVLAVRQIRARKELVDLFADGPAGDELGPVLRRADLVELDAGAFELDRQAVRPGQGRLRPADAAPGVAGHRGSPRPHFARPLFVLAAALLKAADPGLEVGALSEDDVFGEILDQHEAKYWDKWT